MKKILLLFTAILIGATSCSKFLEEDPRGELMGENTFNTVDDIEKIIPSLMNAVGTFYADGCSYNMSVKSDDMTAILKPEMELCKTPTSESYLSDHWNKAYGIIREANAFFQNVGNISTTTDEEKTRLKYLTGYAYFYRGWGYSLIARWFKQGPIVETVGEGINYKSKSQKRLLEYSVSQLKKAEELLPDNWNGHAFEKEAPMKITAKAALAEMYLFMAGYPYNGGKEYYDSAAFKAKEVIDGAAAQERGFDTYDSMWNKNDPVNNTNDERLLSVYYTAYSKYCSSTTCFFPLEYAGYSWLLGELTFFRNFPDGPRKEITFMLNRPNQKGEMKPWNDSTQALKQPVYLKKVLNPEDDFNNLNKRERWQNSYLAMPLRYTLTALTYAEAITRATGTPDALAKKLMNTIRDRAKLPHYSDGLTGTAYADSVVQERAWEMAAEWTRWNDICRLELFEKVFGDRAEDETNPSSGLGIPSHDDYFLDLPPADVALNPNLKEIED